MEWSFASLLRRLYGAWKQALKHWSIEGLEGWRVGGRWIEKTEKIGKDTTIIQYRAVSRRVWPSISQHFPAFFVKIHGERQGRRFCTNLLENRLHEMVRIVRIVWIMDVLIARNLALWAWAVVVAVVAVVVVVCNAQEFENLPHEGSKEI